MDPIELLAECFEALIDIERKTREAERGQSYDDPEGRKILVAAREVRSQVERPRAYLDRWLDGDRS